MTAPTTILIGADTGITGTPIGADTGITGNPAEAVIHEKGIANLEALLQAHSFTTAPITKAFLNAHKRGAKVTAILDKSRRGGGKDSSADFLRDAGIPARIEGQPRVAAGTAWTRETRWRSSFPFGIISVSLASGRYWMVNPVP